MLDTATVKRINEFVHAKPRTIQEIALMLNVNWRTADRYVDKIAQDNGTISTRTFREGTRGALKIVFWQHLERLAASEVQERLLKQIEAGRTRDDFSPSEIFQFVDPNKRKLVKLREHEYNSFQNLKNFINHLKGARQQILFFSGNLTWSNLADHDKEIQQVLEQLARRKVSAKILTRVELAGLNNVKNILALNSRAGWDAVDIRHGYQPLRCSIIDETTAVFKEVLYPEKYAPKELKEKTYLLYYIYDEEWIKWLQKVFWHLYRPAVNAKTRLKLVESFEHFSQNTATRSK